MTESELRAIIRSIKPECADIASNQALYGSSEFDSFDILQLITRIELETGVSLDLVQLLKTDFNLSDLCRVISERSKEC